MKEIIVEKNKPIKLTSRNHGRFLVVKETNRGLFLRYQNMDIHLDLVYASIDKNIKEVRKYSL